MLPSIPCCKWVKSPRPTCGPWIHTTDLGLAHPGLPHGHHPHKILMKDIYVPPSLDICAAPSHLFQGCMWVFGSRQAVLFIVDQGWGVERSSLLVSSWVMVAWPCYCTDQWSYCLRTCISLHPVLESILTESSCLYQDIRICTASF